MTAPHRKDPAMAERMIDAGGVSLCAEAFGEAGDPPILLVMGAAASMLGWPDGLVERLAAAGRLVIRYDHRDTGRSTAYPPGETPYSLDDLADDALAVLDGYSLGSAHVVGMSMGGLLGQILAVRDPARVRTLTLIASEIFADPGFAAPPIDPAIMAHFATTAGLDWTNDAAVAGFIAGLWRLCGRRPFEAEPAQAMAAREVARARSRASMLNHMRLAGGEDWYGRIADIAQPVLAIHGTADPVVAFAHAEAIAARAPDARLLPLEGAGHELHSTDWDAIVAAIASHTG